MARTKQTSTTTLQCFKSDLYAITSSDTDKQCIAPTATKARCKHDVGRSYLDEARQLQSDIMDSTKPQDLRNKCRNLVLARCCSQSHRERLRNNHTCLDRVAERYMKHFALPTVPYQGTEKAKEYNNRHAVVPYASSSFANIESTIRQSTAKQVKSGVVYAFETRVYKGVAKIGYSGSSAAKRLADLAECMPDQTLLIERRYPWPRRMERLIHLELHAQRRKVVQCWSCARTHYEFFEVSASRAKEVVRNWYTLVERDALYDKDGQLRSVWKSRLASMRTSITAKNLLDLLDLEEGKDAHNGNKSATEAPNPSSSDAKCVAVGIGDAETATVQQLSLALRALSETAGKLKGAVASLERSLTSSTAGRRRITMIDI